jgi:hypothetical protein
MMALTMSFGSEELGEKNLKTGGELRKWEEADGLF